MANVTWVGKATPVRETKTVTFTSATVGQVRSMTIDGKTLGITAAGSMTAAEVAAAVYALWQVTVFGQWLQIDVAINGTTPAQLDLTGPTDGAPFTVTAATGATAANVVTGTGPHHADNVLNYSSGALPVDGVDSLTFERGASFEGPKYALTALAAIDLVRVLRRAGFAGVWGLKPINDAGFYEYRTRYLQLKCPDIVIEGAAGDVANQLNFECVHTGSAASVSIRSDGATVADAVDFYGTPANSTVDVAGGSALIAGLIGQTAAVLTLRTNAATVAGGLGVTHGTVDADNGSAVTLRSNFVAARCDNGSVLTVEDTAANAPADPADIGVTIDGGEVRWRSTGTPGNVDVATDATFTADGASTFAVGTIRVYSRATVNDPTNNIEVPFDVAYVRCMPSEVVLNFGADRQAEFDAI